MSVIGIDLGTTNSLCAVWRNDSVEIIPNRLGHKMTPSVVHINKNNQLSVGQVAKEQLITQSSQTVAAFKRLMGTRHTIRIGKKEMSAIELSSLVLKSLKEDAETYLQESVTRAVISVPAYFNDNQRNATKLAAELAGLTVERLINEPTAAAVAHGVHKKEDGIFLILDLGGGTFDVSILEFFDGVMEVHASAGDNFLGGEDFVDALVDMFLSEQEIKKSDLSPFELHDLHMKMEQAKRTFNHEKEIPLSFTYKDVTIENKLSYEWFMKAITPILMRIKSPITQALSDSNLSLTDIDDIILVGGATKLEPFRRTIAQLLKRIPNTNINPDEVVVHGAAIQAGLINRDQALDDVVLTDVCPFTLGTEINNPNGGERAGGHFLPIIERNTTVPVSIVRTLESAYDNQTELLVNVYQGENRLVDKNIYLGTLSVKVPKGPAGKEKIDVRYSYDMNGILEVDVTVLSTEKKSNLLIENSPGHLSDIELEKIRKQLEKLKFHPRDDEINRAILARGERLYEQNLGELREYIAEVLAKFDNIVDRQNPQEIKKAQIQINEIFDSLEKGSW
ncbi:Hsp70 family protein [Pleionea sediminis]|uniref:Hsp70 family protein n=1 Tax=Pleionea sediminis TaxID=2569479 RepID=UPI001184EF54|nr:molecular chaperone HscC [Pleionea sediminis]